MITIIVLLILAGVTIRLAVNDQGIFSKAKKATEAYKKTNAGEQLGELLYEYQIEKATNDEIKLKDFLIGKDGIDDVEDKGDGKKNTENMIKRMKNHASYDPDYGEATTGTQADIWNIIEDKVNDEWFVPSKEEWAAFASYLNPSTTRTDLNYYANYGLSNSYWSSSQYNNEDAYNIDFYDSCMGINDSHMAFDCVDCTLFVRLASTF